MGGGGFYRQSARAYIDVWVDYLPKMLPETTSPIPAQDLLEALDYENNNAILRSWKRDRLE